MHHKSFDVQVFDTVDVVALYLGKTLDFKQMPKIKAIVEFLVGNSETFSFDDEARLLKIQQMLIKKLPWLGSVRYNRKELDKMIKNLVHNHGISLKLSNSTD